MKKSSFTEEQIAFALRQTEGGASIREVCRKMGVSEQTFLRWKKKPARGAVGASSFPPAQTTRTSGSHAGVAPGA